MIEVEHEACIYIHAFTGEQHYQTMKVMGLIDKIQYTFL